MNKKITNALLAIFTIAFGLGVYYVIYNLNSSKLPESFSYGNGRLEATEVDIATKYPGKLSEVLVEEGEMVEKGQLLAKVDTKMLEARLKQAKAMLEQAAQQEQYARAIITQRKSELSLAIKNLERSKTLYANKNISLVQLQQHDTVVETAKASLAAAKAQVVSAKAGINAAKAEVETIQVNIDESNLYSPISGRVLYKLAEPGEVVGSGTKLYTILKLTDVYMTIFLPTAQAGRVTVGGEARIVIDALPDTPIPAVVSFVSPEAQFTPKEIETASEREKLMFRIKVKIDSGLLKTHINKVKSGLPGIAYVRLDDTSPWPESLQVDDDGKIAQ